MTAAADVIPVVVTITGVGVVAQVVADKLRVPSVLFLILAGVLVGPEGLGLVSRADFGEALPAIVGLSVAIIVFEGAFHLRLDRLRQAPRETLRLVTAGAAVSFLGTAAVVYYVIGAPSDISLLVGALLIATGPTVITPIMNVVAVRERVASTLETEGVVNDVTAAILAIVMFEFVVLETRGLPTLITEFAARLGLGVLVGCSVAAVVWYVLRHVDLSVENAPQNARLIVLVASIAMYGIADWFLPEAGIAAVAAGGFVLGNAPIPYRDDIEQFKGDVSLLVIAFVFVTLASLLSLDTLLELGLRGVLAVVLIAGVLRPLLVFLSTVGDRFTFRERLFVSALGPRGIIPASVATLFAVGLRSAADEAATAAEAAALNAQADLLVGTVFLVIFATVVFEGGLARHVAQALDVIPMRTIIVGGGRVGVALAERLEDRGEEVLIVERDEERVKTLRQSGFSVRQGDGSQQEILENAGIGNAKVVGLATADDDVNLLIGQLARNTYGVETVVARVNQPANSDAFRDLDIEAISAWESIAHEMDNVIERPGIARWMTELDRDGDVQEVAVSSPDVAGQTVSDFRDRLPEDCHLALISRGEDNRLPHVDDVIRDGDHLTFIGRREPVHEAIEICRS